MSPRPAIIPTPALRYWRQRRRLSQRELDEHIGVNRTTVARVERGLPADRETIRRLAEAFDITSDDLIRQPPGFDDSSVTPPES